MNLNDPSVLIVDDVANPVFSVRLTDNAVLAAEARHSGIAADGNLGNVRAQKSCHQVFRFFDVILLAAWPGEGCPPCKAGWPVNVN